MPDTKQTIGSEWKPVFRAGDYREYDKKTGVCINPNDDWTPERIAMVADSYDPAYHESPICLGHPEDDAPAYGWIAGLKKVGDVLHAKFSDLTPEVVEAVRAKKYKKVSAAIYYDLDGKGPYFRHLALLGAMPPHVKGLGSVNFAEHSSSAFAEIETDLIFTNMEEPMKDPKITALAAKHGISYEAAAAIAADLAAPDNAKPDAGAPPAITEPAKTDDTTPLATDAVTTPAATTAPDATATFADREKATLLARITALERDASRRESVTFADGLVADGRLIPTLRDDVADLLTALPATMSATFADGKTGSVADRLRSLLKKLPTAVTYGTITQQTAAESATFSETRKREYYRANSQYFTGVSEDDYVKYGPDPKN